MISFQQLIPINKRSDTAVYLQIANAMILHIRRGVLRKGSRLPGSRELAAVLQVNRNTVNAALDELLAQGWIEAVPRKGMFVVNTLPVVRPSRLAPEAPAPRYAARTNFPLDEKKIVPVPPGRPKRWDLLSIDDGFPDTRLSPVNILMREIRRLSALPSFRPYLTYGAAAGAARLIETLAVFLSDTRGLNIQPANIMITNGAQMGLHLAGKVLLQPGDTVIVGEPGYFAANLTFQQAGAVLRRAPVDHNGIDTDAVAALCKKRRPRLLYVIPHHHHPTTVTLSPERRMHLLELAARYKFAIIEDDYDYDFHYSSNPVLPMASLDHHGNVIYIGTLNKTLAPAIRVGFMVAPENFIRLAAQARRLIDWQGDTMMEAAIAELYRNGTITRHINKVVKIYHERRDHFCALLKTTLGNHVSFAIPEGGMSVWATFHGANLPDIAERAFAKGLSISNGAIYNTGTRNYNATRMGFASLSLPEQERALKLLAACL